VLGFIQNDIEHARFVERVHSRLTPPAVDLCMVSGSALGLLHVLTNDHALFRLIQVVTGCGPLTTFDGSIHRMTPGTTHRDSWHSDMVDSRILALSLNLGRHEYSGGVLQIRDEVSGRIVHEVANRGQGDAIVFRLSDRLRHRVTGVEGLVERTVWAGWFRASHRQLALRE
jgi:hypothetical protein